MNEDEKRDFYVKHKNYSAAVELLGHQNRLGMDVELLKNELYYRMGNAAYPQKWAENMFRQYPYDFEIRNRIGYFYLRRMKRLNDALICFRESLKVKPDQSGIKKLYDYLVKHREKLDGYVL